MYKPNSHIKGRGAQIHISNRFEGLEHEIYDGFLEYCRKAEEQIPNRTEYLPIFPKTIVNKVTSPDIPMPFSMNPYQGCEHGCVYCYARNTHEYWGHGPALDFEQKILVKEKAPDLLRQQLSKKAWKPNTIVLSGNTDCYQPAEKKFELTRKCLQVFLEFRHPVGIITKNSLVLRDLNILEELNKFGLIAVHISITSQSEEIRRILEPRTSTIKKRLETIKTLSDKNIPVNAMLAPMIPGLNSHELIPLAKIARNHGARSFAYTMLRLNGAVAKIFEDWLRRTVPDKANKILNLVKSCHSGQLGNSEFGKRMRGSGRFPDHLALMASIAKSRFYKNQKMPALETKHFIRPLPNQLRLF